MRAQTLQTKESGQSMVEFVLALAFAVVVMAGVSFALRKSLRSFWWGIAREVTAPCPDCKPPPELKKKP